MLAAGEKTIEEVVKRIIGAVKPDKIILFGSHAAGRESRTAILI